MLNATLVAALGTETAFGNGTHGTIGSSQVWMTEKGEFFEITESGIFSGEVSFTRLVSHGAACPKRHHADGAYRSSTSRTRRRSLPTSLSFATRLLQSLDRTRRSTTASLHLEHSRLGKVALTLIPSISDVMHHFRRQLSSYFVRIGLASSASPSRPLHNHCR